MAGVLIGTALEADEGDGETIHGFGACGGWVEVWVNSEGGRALGDVELRR